MTINGSDLMLFITKNNVKKSIAYSTSHTLSVSADTKDLSTKDNGNGVWENSEMGMMSWECSSENLVNDTSTTGLSFNDLFEIFLKRQPVEVAIAMQTNIPDYASKLDEDYVVPTGGWTPNANNYYFGDAIITSLDLTATNGEKATFSCSLKGMGALRLKGSGFQLGDTQTLSAPAPKTTK